MVAYQVREDTYLGGYDTRQYSEDTARRIDEAVQKLLQEQYDKVKQLLTEKKDVLERVTRVLLERETLNAEEFVRVVEGQDLESVKPPSEPLKDKEEREPPRIVPKIKPNLGGA